VKNNLNLRTYFTVINHNCMEWLLTCCFTSLLRILHSWKNHHCQRRTKKFRPMLNASHYIVLHLLWHGGLDFCSLVWRSTAPFTAVTFTTSKGYWGPIFTQIPTGQIKVAFWKYSSNCEASWPSSLFKRSNCSCFWFKKKKRRHPSTVPFCIMQVSPKHYAISHMGS
jgi:hypothetical protein